MKFQFDFSPSVVHHKIAATITPSLRFKGQEVLTWQKRLRLRLASLLGETPGRPCRLNPQVLWKKKTANGTLEKIVFTSEPGADVPAYVSVPEKPDGKLPFMICLQGHTSGMHNSIGMDSSARKKIDVEGDRDFAVQCLRHGIAAISVEQRSFGERGEKLQKMTAPCGYCHDSAMRSLMLGRTLLGERIYDVRRAVDYLRTRTDVNCRKIGVMGNSAGGTASILAGVMIDAIGFIMSSCSFCSYRESWMSIYHCACSYIPGIFRYADMGDIAGLAAPKPLVLVAGKNDPLAPVKAVRKEFLHLKKIYRAMGAAENVRLVVGEGGHRFYADKAWPVLLEILG